MRAFRHTSVENQKKIFKSFPMLRSDYENSELDIYWDDYPGLEYACVSIWDHWLYLSGNDHLIDNANNKTILEWKEKFRNLNNLILDNTEVFLLSWGKKNRIKEVRCMSEVKKRLDPNDRRGFTLLLPELKIIYDPGDSDPHSRVTYHQSEEGSKVFDKWVSQCGLKYVQNYDPSMKKALEEANKIET